MQLYANLNDDRYEDYHRMLYVFVCISEKCIGTQNAVKVFKCVIPHDNKFIKFASEEEYDKIWGKTDNQLISMGYKINKKGDQVDQIDSSSVKETEEEKL